MTAQEIVDALASGKAGILYLSRSNTGKWEWYDRGDRRWRRGDSFEHCVSMVLSQSGKRFTEVAA